MSTKAPIVLPVGTPPPEDLLEALVHLRTVGFEDIYRGAEPPALSVETVPPSSPRPASHSLPIESPLPSSPAIGTAAAAAESGIPVAEPVSADAEERIAALGALEKVALECVRCQLCRTRQRVVFGAGDPRARLLLIGEGPGEQEDEQGLPFVGPAGQLLNKIIEAIGWRRDQVYITSVVKCRPPNNRNPEPAEASACRGFLDRQIDLIAPKVIVALGKVAAQTLLGNNLALGAMRGEWHSVRGIPTRVTYHPAALLRSSSLKRPTWEDMQLVRDLLRG